MISHELKCIFVHIPRCAGTSIEEWLVGKDWWQIDPPSKHLLASQAKALYAQHWPHYFKFAIVRNPYTRFASSLHFSHHYGLVREAGKDIDFGGYRRLFGTDVVVECDHRYAARSDLISSRHKPHCVYGNLLDEPLDFIAQYENLKPDLDYVRDAIGAPTAFAHHTEVSLSEHVALTVADQRAVETLYRDDFARFGYSREYLNRHAMPGPIAGVSKIDRQDGDDRALDLAARLVRASAALRERRFEDAERLLAVRDPGEAYSVARLQLLGALYHATGRLEGAADCFRRILRLDPRYHLTYTDLAIVLWEMERPWQALVQLERAIDEWPRFARAIELYERYRAAVEAQSPVRGRLWRTKRIVTGSYKVRSARKAVDRVARRLMQRVGGSRPELGDAE
jgi:tetratricopeptide (TPR) repeat protein